MRDEQKTKVQLLNELAGATQRIVEFVTMETEYKELLEIEEGLRQLVEHIPQVFWLHDTITDRLVYVSPAYERIWGRAVSDLYQNFSDWFDGIHVDDCERICSAFAKVAEGNNYAETYRVVQPDGNVLWVRDCGYPVRDSEGKVLRIAGIAQDITELRQTQLRLLKP